MNSFLRALTLLWTLALGTAAPCMAAALDAGDQGTYAVVRRDKSLGMVMRLFQHNGGWQIDRQMPDGSWQNVTCETECILADSSPADVERFLGKPPEGRSAACLHNSAFAVCRLEVGSQAGSREYRFVALLEKDPIVLTLVRQSGPPAPPSTNQLSRDGFSSMVLVTTDADWQAKWNTPPETHPEFTTTRTIRRGGTIHVLTFFTNPKLDGEGFADIGCGIEIIRPDGAISSKQDEVPCFKTKLANPKLTYMTGAVIKFVADPDDPAGLWRFKLTVRDRVRNVLLPLSTEVTLTDE